MQSQQLILVVLAAATILLGDGVRGNPVPCRAEDLWPLVKQDLQLATLYRDEGINGIRRAIDFYERRSWQFPQWPAAWQPPKNQTWCDYGPGATTAAQFLSATATGTVPLPPSIQIMMDGLIRYRLYTPGSMGCSGAQLMQCDPETEQCICKCPAGSPDDTSCASVDACQNSLVTASTVLTSILIALGVLGLCIAAVILTRALNAILDMCNLLMQLPTLSPSPPPPSSASESTSMPTPSEPQSPPPPISLSSAAHGVTNYTTTALRPSTKRPRDATSMLGEELVLTGGLQGPLTKL